MFFSGGGRSKDAADTLEIAGRVVAVAFLKSPRARRITLRADPARGRVTVSYPRYGSLRRAQRFLQEKRDWLESRIARWPDSKPLVDGVTFPLEGRDVVIQHVAHAPRTPELIHTGALPQLRVGGPADMLSVRLEGWLRSRARRMLTAETRQVASQNGLAERVTRISVRDTTSRWGSCNPHLGTFNYSWRLICAPPLVRQAIVAHEVAHLVHRGHGPEFHALADLFAGSTQAQADTWLRAHGAGLHLIGR